MKKQIVNLLSSAARIGVAASVIAAAGIAVSASAGQSPAPENSCAFGKSLAQWQALYWRWTYGDVNIPTDSNGNAVVGGNVVLMPLPNAPGDGTPARIAVTLKTGQAFVLPLWNLLGNSYTDGTPDDSFVDVKVFRTLTLTLKIDGVTVINGDDVMDYYSQFSFVPPITLPTADAPLAAVIWLQGISFTHTPLTPGKHVIQLDAVNTDTADLFGLTIAYHNTWNITVSH